MRARRIFLALWMLVSTSAFAAPPALKIVRTAPAMSAEEMVSMLRSKTQKVELAIKERNRRHKEWKNSINARDATAAMVQSLKKAGSRLDKTVQQALSLDEEVARTRSRLLESEARLARLGADLLSVYNLVLRTKRTEARSRNAGVRKRAIENYRLLAAKRDQVRVALRPISSVQTSEGELSLKVNENDDIESLLEKADLARDLEERYLRRAKSIKSRIKELEEEASLADDLANMSRADSLFDENSSRLILNGAGTRVRERQNGGNSLAAPAAGRQEETADSAEFEANAPAAEPAPPPGAIENDPVAADPVAADPDADGVVDDGATNGSVEIPTIQSERVFLGNNVDLSSLMTSGSLAELKALEKKILQEARSARRTNEKIKKELSKRTKR